MPRRLGGDATSEDLALDKKRVKRVLHVLSQSLKAWDAADRIAQIDLTDELRREGAQLNWAQFAADYRAYLEGRIKYVATWSTQTGHTEWGKKAVVRLNNERSWLEYAMRD
jgi:hypothetical protein